MLMPMTMLMLLKLLVDSVLLVDTAAQAESMSADFVLILRYLCEALAASKPADQAEPLMLEGILIMLHGAPATVTRSAEFHDIVWSVT